MTVLVTGSNGMLGHSVCNRARLRGFDVIGLDLADADYNVDMKDDAALAGAFDEIRPDMVVNCAAIIDIGLCDSDPATAWKVNARAVSMQTELCRKFGTKLVQISTEHYFSGDGPAKHDELSPVSFLNEYARTKFAGEAFALIDPTSLVLRTNIIGFRGHGKPTFAEWAFDAIEKDQEMTLFEDSYVSCIDTESFSIALMDLAGKNACGLFNVASHDVFSKKELIEKIASQTGHQLSQALTGSVSQLNVQRADSCGLDVSKGEDVLGYRLPTLDEVVMQLVEKRRGGNAD